MPRILWLYRILRLERAELRLRQIRRHRHADTGTRDASGGDIHIWNAGGRDIGGECGVRRHHRHRDGPRRHRHAGRGRLLLPRQSRHPRCLSLLAEHLPHIGNHSDDEGQRVAGRSDQIMGIYRFDTVAHALGELLCHVLVRVVGHVEEDGIPLDIHAAPIPLVGEFKSVGHTLQPCRIGFQIVVETGQ